MSSTRPLRRTAALAAVAVVALSACGNNADDDGGSDGGSSGGGSSASGEQPDVNGDGDVKIGVLSPGDLNDNGYYESFVVKAQEFVDSQDGWELIKVGEINPADALEQARNMCRQGVDMVALAASELADALPAAEEDVCAGTIWYLPSQTEGYELADNVVLSQDSASESLLAAGYALGLLMQGSGATTAGFVTGPELDFSIIAAQAFQAGVRQIVPDAEVVTTYTGDFDDSGLAVEATQAQIGQGIGGLYPYLGGATDASAELGFEAGIPVLTPGTDRCGDGYAISVIFDPGEYFAVALEDFANGELEGGTTRLWKMGVDPLPTVQFCEDSGVTPEQEQQLADFIASVGDGTIDPDAEVERLGS
ncbi:BMP family ABC transporter substrate-binding protein [Blastococcus sp. TF02A-26]|uniref:BMP family ABC transporter substrate-binding protein n=1 Tax=Blastococcus sp. TF02A-26 TaxID=2250577 RepID=UPI000DE8E5BA|nr:BMP family ABC transporter substrate-binding protein [Blastococcus sp. TF02A-26]RBY82761.1 BMP family ABC transporter substrate-binding protein [Blastococcus sp. TF02A-26]